MDPSPGSYVAMDDEQVREMLLKRRDAEAADPFAQLTGAITPGWIREQLLDDQLAAALQAAQQRHDAGAWPQVGVEVEEALAKPTQRETLERRRQELLDLLEEVNDELGALDEKPSAGLPIEEPANTP